MSPAAIRNAVVADQWSFVSSHGGLNFYIGNSADATGFYVNVPGITPTIAGQETDARRMAERALGHPVTDAETSSYFFGLAWSWIRGHPGDALALFARKLYYVFNAAHVPLPHSFPFFASDANTALRFYAIGPWLLIPLGLAGLLFAPVRARRAEYLVWASFVPAYAVSVALFFVAERYRLPLLVPFCVGAGAALAALGSGLQTGTMPGSGLETASRGARSRLARGRGAPVDEAPTRPKSRPDPEFRRIRRPDPGLFAAAAIFAVAANWPLALNDGRWDEGLRLAQRLAITKQYDEADRWIAHINAADPSRAGAAHYGLGEQLFLLSQTDRAAGHLAAAHKADPAEPRVEYALGRALLKAGRAREAIPHLRRGFEAGVEIPGGGFDYAVALHDVGDPAVAGVIKRVRPSDIDDVEVWLRLGRMASQARAPNVAEPFFRRAAEMRPGLAPTRQQFGLNLLLLGRFAEAERELAEAVRLDPRDPDSLAHLGYCELRLGRAADARVHARAALAIDPGHRLAGDILRGGAPDDR
jgi:tetratricopeptide (TPR) repeat protein